MACPLTSSLETTSQCPKAPLNEHATLCEAWHCLCFVHPDQFADISHYQVEATIEKQAVVRGQDRP